MSGVITLLARHEQLEIRDNKILPDSFAGGHWAAVHSGGKIYPIPSHSIVLCWSLEPKRHLASVTCSLPLIGWTLLNSVRLTLCFYGTDKYATDTPIIHDTDITPHSTMIFGEIGQFIWSRATIDF